MLMELLYRFCQITQPEIGLLVGGIDYSAVSQARKRLQVKLEQDPKMKDRFDKLSNRLLQFSRGNRPERFDPIISKHYEVEQ